MKTKSFIISLLVVVFMIGFVSCTGNKSKEGGDATAKEEVKGEEKSDEAVKPVISAADLVKIYDQLEDKEYIKKNYSDKLTSLFTNDYKTREDLAGADWFTEVWGVNMEYDSSKEMYEESFTKKGDDALAVVVNHTDDPDATIYFFNPDFKDLYLKEIEGELGYKHFVGDDEFKNHFDLYAQDGYTFGDGGFAAFTIEETKGIYSLRLAYGN